MFFSNSPAETGNLVTANVTFDVDISPLSSVGLFTAGEDDVQVKAAFNGWDCPEDNQDDCGLFQDAIAPTNYNAQIPITSAPSTEQEYKYFIDFNLENGDPQFLNADGSELTLGWEEPLDFGGGNRRFTFAGADQDLGTQFFNSIRPGNVIDDGTTVDVTFTVDMNNATTFSRPFDPAQDTVTVYFEDPLWLATQGYDLTGDDGELVIVGDVRVINGFQLEDPDGDGIYTGTITVNGPTYNAIAYHYAYGRDGEAGSYEEGTREQGEPGRRRYRYITDTSTGTFMFGKDTFRPNGDDLPTGAERSPLPWEINPTGPFAPGDIANSVANGYDDRGSRVIDVEGPVSGRALAIGRVFPNPTSGAASVEVTAPADAFVTVRVFDVTGRAVATVVEDALVSGRALSIDTRGMAAGLYLVRAEAGGKVASASFTVVR